MPRPLSFGVASRPASRLTSVKRPRPSLLEEHVGRAVVDVGVAVGADARLRVAAELVAVEREVEVARDVEVEVAVAVGVEEPGRARPRRRARGERRGGDAGFGGGVLEGAVAAVSPQQVGTEVGDVEVEVAVAVDVAERGAHAVAVLDDAGLRGRVLEGAVGPLMEEAIAGGRAARRGALVRSAAASAAASGAPCGKKRSSRPSPS